MIFLLQVCFCFVMRKTSCCLFLIIAAFNCTSIYLNDFFYNIYFEQMMGQIYPTALQLNKEHLIVKVNLTSLDGDVPRFSSYSVYISQLICFASVSCNVE